MQECKGKPNILQSRDNDEGTLHEMLDPDWEEDKEEEDDNNEEGRWQCLKQESKLLQLQQDVAVTKEAKDWQEAEKKGPPEFGLMQLTK